MTEQEWWQRKLQRPRPVQPQRLPPLAPREPMLNEPVDDVQQVPPLEQPMRPSANLEQASPMGLPVPQQVESAAEEMPPRMSEQDLDYAQLTSPPKKEKLWKDILYVAGQAAANIFDTEGKEQPIERLGETRKRGKDAAAMQRIGVRNARQKAEQDAAKRTFEIQGEQAETAKKVLQAVQQRNPVLWEAIKQKGFIDANDQAAIQQAGYGYVPTGSWFQTETTYDKDGNLLWTPKTGTPNYQPTGIQDPKQGTSIYKGRPMKPSEAGRLETDEQQFNVRESNDIAAKNAQMQADVARRNIDRDVDYNNRALSVLQKIAESDAAILSANPQMQGYAQSMQVASAKAAAAAQAGDTEAFAAAQAEFDAANENFGKALGNIRGNQKLAAEYRKTIGKRPPKEVFKPIAAQTTDTQSVGTYDRSTFIDRAKARGLKGDELKAAIADAERKGIIK